MVYYSPLYMYRFLTAQLVESKNHAQVGGLLGAVVSMPVDFLARQFKAKAIAESHVYDNWSVQKVVDQTALPHLCPARQERLLAVDSSVSVCA